MKCLRPRARNGSVTYKLAMADAIIYATAVHREAKLVTSDKHFADLAGVVLL
jgi:predicted nucleic acid-binding protein